MAKREQSKDDKFETFYFEVSNWSREYRYGINRHPWEFSPGHFDEHDLIVIQGALRNQTPRKFRQCEFHLLPSLVSREERSDDAEQVGNVWIKDDTLGCSVWMPVDTFHSLPATLAAGKVVEVSVTVCNLRYNKGSTDYFQLCSSLTALEGKGID